MYILPILLGIFLQREVVSVWALSLEKGLKYDILARTLPYHKQEVEKRKALRVR
jgi:hypothetical protein